MATHPPTPSTIYFATGNKKKLEEVSSVSKHTLVLSRAVWRLSVPDCAMLLHCAAVLLVLPLLLACLHPATPQQVVAILAAGHELPFIVEPAKLDLPELQGEPEEISIEKCRIAAKQVWPQGICRAMTGAIAVSAVTSCCCYVCMYVWQGMFRIEAQQVRQKGAGVTAWATGSSTSSSTTVHVTAVQARQHQQWHYGSPATLLCAACCAVVHQAFAANESCLHTHNMETTPDIF
jgi:hypothetical protein